MTPILIAAALAAGALLAWWLAASRARVKLAVLEHSLRETRLLWTEAREQLAKERASLEAAQAAWAAQQAEVARLEERNAAEKRASEQVLEQMRAALPDTFRALASTVLEEKSQSFAERNQAGLNQILAPLNSRLQDFQKKVEEVHQQQLVGGAALREQVNLLIASTSKVSDQANSLANALKGSTKAQGNWGELVLRRILESAGLREGHEYETQESHFTENGRRMQPDVVIYLPEGRRLVIDSKVSLVAYEMHCNAQDDAARLSAANDHLASVRNHIRGLSEKNYQSLYGLKSLDFVIMFLPIEPAFMLALACDEKLWEQAWQKNILLVSPSTLLFVLRTVSYLWRQEQQERNVQEIAKRGAELYNKLASFVSDLSDVGARLEQAQKSYDGAFAKLKTGRGNLIRQAELLRALGVTPSKELPRGLVEEAQQEDLDLQAPADIPGENA